MHAAGGTLQRRPPPARSVLHWGHQQRLRAGALVSQGLKGRAECDAQVLVCVPWQHLEACPAQAEVTAREAHVRLVLCAHAAGGHHIARAHPPDDPACRASCAAQRTPNLRRHEVWVGQRHGPPPAGDALFVEHRLDAARAAERHAAQGRDDRAAEPFRTAALRWTAADSRERGQHPIRGECPGENRVQQLPLRAPAPVAEVWPQVEDMEAPQQRVRPLFAHAAPL
mmetsp:Transcript_9038/g.23435  ORF Transcript_9038/g.23435 Transcript_9038/m.23435 type:complete len:226 (-) Transcript_9038:630-1307(-)